MSMLDRRIIVRGERGTVVKWEPLGAAMCDALIRFDDGRECWYGSHELRPDPQDDLAGIPLSTRQAAREDNDRRMKAQLEAIRARHIAEFHRPWPGCEFGKVHIGQAIDGALADVRGRVANTSRRGF